MNIISSKTYVDPSYTDKPNKSLMKNKIIRAALIFILVFFLVIGYFGYRLYSAGDGVFGGSLLTALTKNDPLQVDKYGRTNFLIFGTSEDDEGHSGKLLADSIMVLSVNPETYEANTISIPRDLWVKYPENCTVGSEGKINATYFCGINNGKSEQDASLDLAKVVSTVIGTDVQYYAKINYSVVRDSVNALGGIEVVINSSDSRGIYDKATDLTLPNGVVVLDGEQALDLARARNAKGGYGLPRSNFDREKNQQLILKAMQDKAKSTGILANPLNITRLSESIGDNIVTNVPSSQLKSILDLSKNTQSSNIETIDLVSKENPLLKTAPINGQSAVVPVAGVFNYSQIHALIEQEFTTNNNQSL